MTRRQGLENTAQERVDAAMIDALERRRARQPAREEDVEFAAEIEAYVQMHRRIATLPQPEVAPSVRAVVLGAAAQVTNGNPQVAQNPLTRLLVLLMRPGPLLAMATAMAVLVALAVRKEPPATTAAPGDSAVAMLDARKVPESAPVAAESAQSAEIPAAAPAAAAPVPEPAAAPLVEAPKYEAQPAEPQVAQGKFAAGKAAAQAEVVPKPPAPVDMPPRPVRTIEAQAASLGPAPAPPAAALDEAPRNHAGAQAYEAENAAPQAVEAKEERAAHENQAAMQAQKNLAESGNAATAKNQRAEQNQPLNRSADQYRAGAADDAETRAPGQASEIKRLQSVYQRASTLEDREQALKQLMAAAHAAGDTTTETWASQQYKSLLGQQNAQNLAKKRAQAVQKSPPMDRAKAAPRQGSDELKAAEPRK